MAAVSVEHVRQHESRELHCGQQIDLHGLNDLIGGKLMKVSMRFDPSIVDQDLNRAEFMEG